MEICTSHKWCYWRMRGPFRLLNSNSNSYFRLKIWRNKRKLINHNRISTQDGKETNNSSSNPGATTILREVVITKWMSCITKHHLMIRAKCNTTTTNNSNSVGEAAIEISNINLKEEIKVGTINRGTWTIVAEILTTTTKITTIITVIIMVVTSNSSENSYYK